MPKALKKVKRSERILVTKSEDLPLILALAPIGALNDTVNKFLVK